MLWHIANAGAGIGQTLKLSQCSAVNQDGASLDALANVGATSDPVHGHAVEISQSH